MIKIALKYLPYSLFKKVYFLFFLKKKRDFTNKIISNNGYKILDIPSISSSRKKSETLFVLGSGYSLNQISPEEWVEINKHDIFGFNFSFLNDDHIPTYYACEAMKPLDVNNEKRSFVGDIFYKTYKSKKNKYKNVVKILSDLEDSRKDHFENYGRDLYDDNFFLVNTINGIADTENKFCEMLKYYDSLGVFNEKEFQNELFKFRATLCMAISFGIKLGYKKIVLCGIDLNDPRYFYSDREKYPHLPEFRSSKDTAQHATILSNPLFLAIDKVVYLMNELICKPRGISLYVQNEESALSSFLNVYNILK